MSKYKCLVITLNAWNNANNTGNTATNIFSSIQDDYQFANIFCRNESPDNDLCDKYFRITEEDFLKARLFGSSIGTPGDYSAFHKVTNEQDRNAKLHGAMRNHRWHVLLWVREALWRVASWKNERLESFAKEFDPDIVYMPIHDNWYMHDVLNAVCKATKAKVILYTGDDMYTYGQFRLSPLYWINRTVLRSKIRRSIRSATRVYCMSEEQAKRFQKEFGDKFRVLRKRVTTEPQRPSGAISDTKPLKMVFTGNIGLGRWEQLTAIAQAVDELSPNSAPAASIEVYTTQSFAPAMRTQTDRIDSLTFKGAISPSEVVAVQEAADVLIHIESFGLRERLKCKFSFSTKLADYFQRQKAIFAVGPKGINSIDYLLANDAAIVATSPDEIRERLKQIIEDRSLIEVYATKSWQCGVQKHSSEKIQAMLKQDFREMLSGIVN